MAKTRLEGYGTLLPAKWKEIYEQVEGESFDDRPQSARAAAGVPDQVALMSSTLKPLLPLSKCPAEDPLCIKPVKQ